MTLEQTLAEVGPIFNNGSFPLASIQDVMTAKYFFDKISHGMSIRYAYLNFWTKEVERDSFLGPPLKERVLQPSFKPALLRMVGMLDKDGANNFIEVLTDIYFNSNCELHTFGTVFEHLLFSVQCIGMNQFLYDSTTGRVKQIFDSILREAKVPRGISKSVDDFSELKSPFCNARSSYAAKCLVDMICSASEWNDFSVERYNKNIRWTWDALRELLQSGVEFPETFLIEEFDKYNNKHSSVFNEWHRGIIHLMGLYGGKKSLEKMLTLMTDYTHINTWCLHFDEMKIYLNNIFDLIERHDFDPELVTLFNETLPKTRDAEFVTKYIMALGIFAYGRHDRYERFKKLNTQFSGWQFAQDYIRQIFDLKNDT